MSCSDYKNRACWLHTCLDAAQLSATDTLPVSADKTMAQTENPQTFTPGKETQLIKTFSLNRLPEESKMETFLIQHKYRDTMMANRISKWNSIQGSW